MSDDIPQHQVGMYVDTPLMQKIRDRRKAREDAAWKRGVNDAADYVRDWASGCGSNIAPAMLIVAEMVRRMDPPERTETE